MTPANLLTVSRLAAVPLILLSAWLRQPAWFVVLLAYALLTDTLDGVIARRRGQATPLGARLDSIADAALSLTVPLAALLLYPLLREREWITIGVVLAAYVVPILFGYAKYRRLTAYHTVAARAAGVLLAASLLAFLALGITWPVRVAAIVLLLSAIEEMLLTAMLREWRANVPSIVHAMRLAGARSGARQSPAKSA